MQMACDALTGLQTLGPLLGLLYTDPALRPLVPGAPFTPFTGPAAAAEPASLLAAAEQLLRVAAKRQQLRGLVGADRLGRESRLFPAQVPATASVEGLLFVAKALLHELTVSPALCASLAASDAAAARATLGRVQSVAATAAKLGRCMAGIPMMDARFRGDDSRHPQV